MSTKGFIFIVFLFLVLDSQGQLIERSTLGPTHQSVQFTSDDLGFVLAYAEPDGSLPNGLLRKTSDGGTTWVSIPITFTSSNPDFEEVNTIIVQDLLQMLDGNRGFCAGALNSETDNTFMILKTDDGGSSWTGTPFIENEFIESMYFVDDLTGYVGIAQKVYKTTDGGLTWTIALEPGFGGSFIVINFISETIGFACAPGRVYKTIDSGLTWDLASIGEGNSTQNISSIKFISEEIGFISTLNGKVLRTLDSGENWETIFNEGINDKLTSISIVNDKIVIGGYNDGSASECNTFLLFSTDNGELWTKECFNFPFPEPRNVQSTFFITETKGFLGVVGGMYEYNSDPSFVTNPRVNDEGYAKIFPNPSDGLFEIEGASDSDVWNVFNNLGKLVLKGKGNQVDLETQESGLYVLKIFKDGVQLPTIRLIKQ